MYADAEEGLGVVLECILSGDFENSPAFERARDRYIQAGLALGTDGTAKDGRQTFELMWRLLALRHTKDGEVSSDIIAKARKQAMTHDDNAFRGTNFAKPGVIYSKLKVYYEGLMKNVDYLKDNMDDLEKAIEVAMIGKYDHTNQYERRLVTTILEKNT